MKWREPWIATLKAQEPFIPATFGPLKSSVSWAFLVACIGVLFAIAKGVPFSTVMERLWMIVTLAILLSFFLYWAQWLSPREVSSGPRGIVRSKGGKQLLIPWNAILAYEVISKHELRLLRISIAGQGDDETFFLPPDLQVQEIEEELKRMTGA